MHWEGMRGTRLVWVGGFAETLLSKKKEVFAEAIFSVLTHFIRGYVTTSTVVEVGVYRVTCLGYVGPEQGERDLYFCQSQDEIFWSLDTP